MPSVLTFMNRLFPIAVFVLPLAGLGATYLFRHNIGLAERQLELHQSVLEGSAPTVYQFQMPLHCIILDKLYRISGRANSGRFSILYTCYYLIGYFLACLAMYSLSREYASNRCSAAACLYLVALLPFFSYDSYFHPGDPWGLALAALLVKALSSKWPKWQYLALLALSGFVWEKHVLIPVSYAFVEWRRGKRLSEVVLFAIVSLLAAGFGQVVFRLSYGYQEAGVGSLSENIAKFHYYLFGLIVTQGLALWFCLVRPRRIPLIMYALILQTPLWLLIYLALNGYIFEYRAVFLISMVYVVPVLAIALSDQDGLGLRPQEKRESE